MTLERSQTTRARQLRRRGLGSAAAVLTAAVAFLLVNTPLGIAAAAEVPRHPGGFWKCPPRGNVKGAFDNEDPVALAAHSHVATDCALHWSDGHGATYCFATPPSLLLFKEEPDILVKAQAFWRQSHTQK